MAFSTRHTTAGRADLVDRDPANAAGPLVGTRLAVIVRVSGAEARARHCALIATDVAEVMRPLPIEPLPGIPSFVRGLSVIRGAPTPVVDTAALLGEKRREPLIDQASGDNAAAHARFVVMRVGERRVALAVEAVLGVRPLAGDMLQALPPLLRHASETIVAALGTHDAQLLTVLAGGGYLLPPAAWEALAASKAPA